MVNLLPFFIIFIKKVETTSCDLSAALLSLFATERVIRWFIEHNATIRQRVKKAVP